jgi:hypothetical protein
MRTDGKSWDVVGLGEVSYAHEQNIMHNGVIIVPRNDFKQPSPYYYKVYNAIKDDQHSLWRFVLCVQWCVDVECDHLLSRYKKILNFILFYFVFNFLPF